MLCSRSTVALRRHVWLALAVSLACCGCSGSSGSFTLFPNGDFLLDSTKDVRKSVPGNALVPRELEKTVLSAYIIQPGDVLLVEPIALDSPLRFPADQTVLPDGTIDLARFGRLVVVGKTLEQIETDVQAAIKAIEKDAGAVNVRLVDPQSAIYYVLGEVTSPGSYPLVGRETVLDAILTAGGMTDKASSCNIILSRPSAPCGCRTVIPICYKRIVQQGDTSTNYQVMPGDRIYVATRTLWESLNPCANSQDCPSCRGKACPCPGACGTATAPTTTYALPGTPAALPAMPIAVDTLSHDRPATLPPGAIRPVVIDDRAVGEGETILARPVVNDPHKNPFGD
ncbi:MAG TPA: polysaccharide biosynthesis/export family protein [Pirellulales bacterium]|jgi:polysaccharide export outer membrane protein|nr:polysaccharide biosynthesis/export family protein [Pirellulales bacterium]